MKKKLFLLVALLSLPLLFLSAKRASSVTPQFATSTTYTPEPEDTQTEPDTPTSDEPLFADFADEPDTPLFEDTVTTDASASDAFPTETETDTYPMTDNQDDDAEADAPEPYKSVYLLDYAELESESDSVPESAFSPHSGRYQFIANADQKDEDGRTLLMKAARSGNISMIENLLYSEADVNAVDNDGWTALMFAARFQNNPQTIALLLDAGANPQTENFYGITALLLAAGFAKNPAIVSALLEQRSLAEKEVLAAFMYALINEAPKETLQLFIEKGIAINAPYEGKTPLMYAAEHNKSTTTIAWLLEHGARTRYKTTSGQTAFDFARTNKRLPRDKIYWSLNTNGASR